MKIAYIGWNIPTVATFVISEIKNVILKGVDVILLPIKLNKDENIQSEYEIVYKNIHNVNFILSVKIWYAFFYFLITKPSILLKTLFEIIFKCRKPIVFFIKTLAILPKSVYFSYYIKKSDIDYVFATWAHYPATMAYLINALSGKPFAFSAHAGADIYRYPYLLKEKIEKAEFVTTCVAANKEFLVSKSGTRYADKIYVNYHGVNLEKFQPNPTKKRFQNKEVKLLSVGNLHAPKGFIYVIRAMRKLLDSGLERTFKYTIVGTGYEQENLNNEISKLNMSDYVEFKSEVSQSDLIKIYDNTDAFIMPSILHESGGRDGVPNVLVEAISLGVPCIGSNVSGLPEAIKHEETGLLVDQKSPEQIKDSVIRLLNEPELVKKISKKGPEWVNKTFDKKKNFEELYLIIKKHFTDREKHES